MPISLLIDQGSFAGRRYVFDKDEVSFGRTEDNDVVVPSEAASRNHAKLKLNGDQYQIEDLRSSNGTRVNGEPLLRPLTLEDGDVIEIGKIRFRFSPYEAANATRIVATPEIPQWEKARLKAPDRPVVKEPLGGEKARSSLRIAGIGGAALFVLFILFKIVTAGPKEDPNAPHQVSGPVTLTQKPDPHSYGVAPGDDRLAPHGVTFVFNFSEPVAGKSMLTLHGQVSAIQHADDIDMLVNGKHLQFLPTTFEEQRQIDLILDRTKLLPNAENTIDFKPASRPGVTWTITGLSIEQESLPTGTPEQLQVEAKQQYDLAENKFQNDQVAAANMYEAWKGYKHARLILAAVPNPSESLKNLVDERVRESENRLAQRCKQMIFTAEKALIVKGKRAANRAASQIFSYFPSADHPCYSRAQSFIKNL